MKEKYITYLKEILANNFPRQKELIDRYLNGESLEYFNADSGLTCLNINYLLFKEENQREKLNENLDYLRKVIKVFKRQVENNVKHEKKIINRMFGVSNFCKMVRVLKEENLLTDEDYEDLYQFSRDLSSWAYNYPEWGAHNRATIRGRGMIEFAKTFPEKPKAGKWLQLGKSLLADSLGKWSIEDAATYHPIWVYDVFDSLDEEWPNYPNLEIILQFYLNFFTYLTNPLFIPTEYGDGRMGTQWGVIVSILERGAARYRNGYYKYVANKIFDKMTSLNIPNSYKINQARSLVDACLNCDESVRPKEPYGGSMEVLEDLVTKKIVFRNGYDEKRSVYLFLNYKDETENGVMGRRNLDHTIVAPAEKNHHGHTDENSINLLTYKDAVLLHDGGYRERIDLLGAFRADFYHNKLIFRNETYPDVWKTISLEPYYNKVKTEKLYFYTTDKFDISRTRVNDFKHQVKYDRAVTYVKEENLFIVLDIVKSLKKQELFISNQYFSQNVEEVRKGLYQTYYDHIGSDEFNSLPNPTDKKLLIYFPALLVESDMHIDEVRRSYTNEVIISNYLTKEFAEGEIYACATVLIPNDGNINRELVDSIKIRPAENGVAIELSHRGWHYTFAHKCDELLGYDPGRRPMYEYEATKVNYGKVETDAIYGGVAENEKEICYAFVAGSKLIKENKTLFEIKEKSDFYQPDISIDYHIGSYNFFTEKITKD